jgi:hypothetical protein
MTFCAPVIGKVAGAVFNHADPDGIKLLRVPIGRSRFAFVFRWGYLRPYRGAKGNIFHVHIDLQTGFIWIGGYTVFGLKLIGRWDL